MSTPSLSELTRSLKSTSLSSQPNTPNNHTLDSSTLSTSSSSSISTIREEHKFQRIIIIHSKTGVSIFDYCFPLAWNAKKADIGGFLASCYQFDATVKGGGIRKIVFQPPSESQSSSQSTSGRIIRQASGTSATTPGLNLIGGTGGSKFRTITPTATLGNQTIGASNPTTPTTSHHTKTNSASSMNILSGFNTIRRRSVHHRSKRNRRTCLNFSDPMGSNSSNLMYIVFGLPNDPISPVLLSSTNSSSFVNSPQTSIDPVCLCAVCFEGGSDELWTEIAKTFASECVREFCTNYKDALEKHKKNFEKLKAEANRDDELERQIVEEFQIFEVLMNKTKQKVLDAFSSRIAESIKLQNSKFSDM